MLRRIENWLGTMESNVEFHLNKDESTALFTHIYLDHLRGVESPYIDTLFINREGYQILIDAVPDDIHDAITNTPFLNIAHDNFKFIDLFAGIGGFRLALQGAGGCCVFSSEWDKSAKKTYLQNHGELPFGDIRNFTDEGISDEKLNQLIPDHDVLAAGFPCQPFSRAGVSARNSLNISHGFECETQGTLFYDIIRIARVKRPKVLFLENVRNLKSHDNGNTFLKIKQSIIALGYSFRSEIINAQTVVPQKRQRCYMVAFREDYEPFEFDLLPFEGEPIPLNSILEPQELVEDYRISERLWLGHQTRTARNIARGTGFVALLADVAKPANTLVARYGKDGKECLVPIDDGPPRKLSKRESARLQGYPENFILPESRTPTYKQLGNSVALPVVLILAGQIINHMEMQDDL